MSAEGYRFLPGDFERFAPGVQGNAEYNDARLEVRRKLDEIGKAGANTLSDGVRDFTSRASLHHPHKINSFKVDRQWVYLSRSDEERKALEAHLGQEIGEDLSSDYFHALLVLEIHHQGLMIGLKVHPKAWWDGENLRRQMGKQSCREALGSAMRNLDGYDLRIHDNKTSRPCPSVDDIEWKSVRKHFTPGEHWIHIEKQIEKDSLFVTSGGFRQRVVDEWERLLPAYRLFGWHPSNDQLFT